MADDSRTFMHYQQQQQPQLPRQQQQQSNHMQSHFSPRDKSRNRHAVKNAIKVEPISQSSCIIILEEGKDLPIFWNGENPVALFTWNHSSEGKRQPCFATIGEFLSTYVAGKYLRICSMSLQASSTKYINNLRMSDPFSKILDRQNKDGKPVTLMLNLSNAEASENGYSKFTLYIREVNNKRVLWDGCMPASRIVAKLSQADMSLTIENCLQNYVAKGYLSQNCQVDVVKECNSNDVNRKLGEELSTISMDALVNTLFTGNSATIAIRSEVSKPSSPVADENGNVNVDARLGASSNSSTGIPVFLATSTSSHWIGHTWDDIREDVRALINTVEVTMRDRILSTDVYANILEKKRALETASRRRNRVVDEIWRCYTTLRNAHNDLLNANTVTDQAGTSSVLSVFETPRHSSHSIIPVRRSTSGFGGDSRNVYPQRSCLDILSSALIRCGMELELFDEESLAMNRLAGVGLGMAVLFAVCTVVFYF